MERYSFKKDGAPFHKGTIGRRLPAFVVKSDIRPDALISHTDFRKWIVAEMQRKKRKGIPIDEDLLRRLMCHSDKTAKQWYLRDDLTEQAAEASTQIAENTKPSPCKKKLCRAKESERTDANTQPSTSKMKLPDAKESEQMVANTTPLTWKMKWPDCNESDNEEESPRSTPSKTSLTSEQQRAIKEAFKDDLEENILPRKKRVVSVMKNHPVLRKIVNSTEMVKKVLDRVRYLLEKLPTMDPFKLPEQSPSEKTQWLNPWNREGLTGLTRTLH